MATVANLEAILRLKNELSPAMASAVKDVKTLEPAVKEAAKQVEELDDSFGKSSHKAGEFADNVGRTATTLARSADAFGLPTQALRTLDDVMDVAELGFNNLSHSAVGFNASTIGVVGAGLAVGTAIGTWLNTFPAVRNTVDQLRDSVVRLFTGVDPKDKLNNATLGLKQFREEMGKVQERANQVMIQAAGGFDAWVKGAMKATDESKKLKEAAEIVGRQVTKMDEAEKILKIKKDSELAAAALKDKLAAAARQAAEEIKRHNDEILRLTERISDVGIAESRAEMLSKLEEVVGKLGGSAALSANEVGRLATEARKAGPEGIAWGQSLMGATNTLPVMKTGLTQLIPPLQKTVEEVKEAGYAFDATARGASLFEKALEKVADGIGKAIQITDALESAFSQMGISAEEGIGQAVKGLGDLAHAGQDAVSSISAFASGDIFGGISSGLRALGGVISGVKNIFNGLFGNSEIMKVNDMRDAFFAAHGGFQAFGAEMAKVSSEDWAKKIFNAKTVEEFNALVKEAQGLLDTQGLAQEKLNEAVQKYGFTIDELGPKWAAQELDKKAGELLQDYELLKASGIDVNTIIARMGPNLNEYVNSAVKAGVAIPESMRSVIDQMYEQGKLLHENGEAFTEQEYKGLSFSKTLSEGMAEVVEQIKALVAALTGIPQSVPPIHVPVVYDDPGRPYHGGPEEPPEGVPAYALGTPYVPRTGLAFLHQGEAVIPPGGMGGSSEVLAELTGLRRDLGALPYMLAKAVKHADQTR